MKRYLVEQTGKRYANSTFVNDCTTMVVRALEQNTNLGFSELIDASPSQVGMNLAMLRAVNDKRVGPIYLVMQEESDRPMKHLLRNAYINAFESRIFIDTFFINQAFRLKHEVTHDESSRQKYDQEVKAYVESWKMDAKEIVHLDPEVALLKKQIEDFKSMPESDSRREQFRHDIQDSAEYVLQEKIEKLEEVLDSKESDFQSLTLAGYKLEELRKIEKEIARLE